jgi:hypothetical protein
MTPRVATHAVTAAPVIRSLSILARGAGCGRGERAAGEAVLAAADHQYLNVGVVGEMRVQNRVLPDEEFGVRHAL